MKITKKYISDADFVAYHLFCPYAGQSDWLEEEPYAPILDNSRIYFEGTCCVVDLSNLPLKAQVEAVPLLRREEAVLLEVLRVNVSGNDDLQRLIFDNKGIPASLYNKITLKIKHTPGISFGDTFFDKLESEAKHEDHSKRI